MWSHRHRKVFSSFFGFIQRKISLSSENIFSLATLSAIIYHIRWNQGIWADNQDWVNQSEYTKCNIRGWEFNNYRYCICKGTGCCLPKKNNPKNLLFCFLELFIFRLAHYLSLMCKKLIFQLAAQAIFWKVLVLLHKLWLHNVPD